MRFEISYQGGTTHEVEPARPPVRRRPRPRLRHRAERRQVLASSRGDRGDPGGRRGPRLGKRQRHLRQRQEGRELAAAARGHAAHGRGEAAPAPRDRRDGDRRSRGPQLRRKRLGADPARRRHRASSPCRRRRGRSAAAPPPAAPAPAGLEAPPRRAAGSQPRPAARPRPSPGARASRGTSRAASGPARHGHPARRALGPVRAARRGRRADGRRTAVRRSRRLGSGRRPRHSARRARNGHGAGLARHGPLGAAPADRDGRARAPRLPVHPRRGDRAPLHDPSRAEGGVRGRDGRTQRPGLGRADLRAVPRRHAGARPGASSRSRSSSFDRADDKH